MSAALLVSAILIPATAAALCVPTCEVTSGGNVVGFFAPPLVVVAAGEFVTWSSLDINHTATDRASFCFHAVYTPAGPASAQFLIESGKLYGKVGAGPLRHCGAATTLPDGSKLLAYECLYHPTMKAQLLVK